MTDPDFSPERARRAIRQGMVTVAVSVVLLAICILAVTQSDLGREAVADLLTRARPVYLVLSWACC
jgi:uncharacterized PurR-regulated membrane protein YhhQ (DUF165 family)